MNIRRMIISKNLIGVLAVIGTIACLYILIDKLSYTVEFFNILAFWKTPVEPTGYWIGVYPNSAPYNYSPKPSVWHYIYSYQWIPTLITAILTTLGAIFSFRGRKWLIVFISSIAMIIYSLVNYYLNYQGYSLFKFNILSITGLLSLVLTILIRKDFIPLSNRKEIHQEKTG